MLGFLLVGIGSGFAAMMVTLALGQSWWMALLSYSLFGALSVLLMALTRAAMLLRIEAALPDGESGRIDPEEWPEAQSVVLRRGGDGQEDVMRSMRILVVDDDPFIRELLPRIAAEVGFPDVTTAGSGIEALDLLTYGGRVYDCLLLDINMPEMDGIELCLKLRAIPAYRDTPVIMLTAMRDMKNMDDAFRAGASDYATKPFDILDLATRLKAANQGILARDGGIAGQGAGRIAVEAPRSHDRQVDVQIEGVPNLIEQRALANYIGRLPRPEVANIAVFAVRIEQEEAVDIQAPTGRLLAMLRGVALAIGEASTSAKADLPGSPAEAGGGLMTYAGRGTFLVAARHCTQTAEAIEAAINHRLAQQSRTATTPAGDPITVVVGTAVQPGGTRMLRAETAFRRALTAVQDRALFKEGQALSAERVHSDRLA
jgi:CheY-like chemotaxis protein